jgi:phage replication O-like protein O
VANVQPDKFTKIANDLLVAMCRAGLTSHEFRVFLSVIRLTYGWNKKDRKISLGDLSEVSGIQRQHVARAISRLTSKNMIKRNGVTGIQKDYDKWVLPNEVVPNGVVPNEVAEVLPNEVAEVLPNEVAPLLLKTKDNERQWTHPSVEQVKAYCSERKNGIDPERFVDFYASKGWMIGKNKMKDWQACVRTWEQHSESKKDTRRYL